MSPVYQNNGPGLGEALVQAFAGYQGAKRQRQLVDEEHEDRIRRNTALDRADVRARAMDAQSGLHILAPGELPPLAVAQAPGNEVAVPDIKAPEIDFTHFLNQEMQTGPRAQPAPGAPSKAAAGALNIPGHPGARANAQSSSDPGSNFQAMMAPALAQAGMPNRGPRFEFGQGYYVDKQPQWDQQDAARAQHTQDQFTPVLVQSLLAKAERDRKVAGYTAAGIPADRAALYVDNPALAENDPKIGRPQVDQMAKKTPRTFTLNGQAVEGFSDEKGNFYDANGKKLSGNITPYSAPSKRDPNQVDPRLKFQADQKNKIIDDFARDTKKFDDVIAGWEVLNGALKQPSFATPFALADAYGRISNPGAIVRPTTMQMIEELGSIDQRFRKFASKSITGQLPEDITKDLVRTIGSMVKEHKGTFDKTRAEALLRAKQEGITDLDPILHNFEFTDPFEPKASPALPPVGGGDTGNIDLRRPSLPDRVQQLRQQGVSKDSARVILRREGYDLVRGAP